MACTSFVTALTLPDRLRFGRGQVFEQFDGAAAGLTLNQQRDDQHRNSVTPVRAGRIGRHPAAGQFLLLVAPGEFIAERRIEVVRDDLKRMTVWPARIDQLMISKASGSCRRRYSIRWFLRYRT
jgi:hypothetical protein